VGKDKSNISSDDAIYCIYLAVMSILLALLGSTMTIV